jgi:branched-chain amino acid transport system ATP-binding protein
MPKSKTAGKINISMQNAAFQEKVFEFFPELAVHRKLSGSRLSGEEQQMLAIGCTVVTNPDILLLEEPSEGLSPVASEREIDICSEL